ncbi:MAG: cytochrome P450, partial [Roseiflexaceae bacterium]
KPLYYDYALGLWVASSAEMITAAFNNRLCRVRPVAEPIPKALLGSPAAEIFRHLVRMNDGAEHCPRKHAVSATLTSVDLAEVNEQSKRWARVLATRYAAEDASGQLADFAFHLPVYVIGSLLGLPETMLHEIAPWIGDFVGCLAPTGSSEQIERGKLAAAHLRAAFGWLLNAQPAQSNAGLLGRLAHEVQQIGREDTDSVIANGIGFLSQAYEATAGLIGNTLLALASHAEARSAVIAQPDNLDNAIQETLRYDPPIQNTRRFLAQDGDIAGQEMPAGATILLLLAAANHDPQANRSPARFDLWRKNRRSFTFGLGAHVCPGEALAPIIAKAGVAQLITADIWSQLGSSFTYRSSANARVPLLGRSAFGV